MDTNLTLQRFTTITPNSQRLWGGMSVGQMLTHCNDQLKITIGEKPCKPRGNALVKTLMKWIALYIPMSMPKNLRTISELDPNKVLMTQPTDFQKDKKELLDTYQRMLNSSVNAHFEHPIFGKLTKEEAIKLSNIHLDHHLKQFGA